MSENPDTPLSAEKKEGLRLPLRPPLTFTPQKAEAWRFPSYPGENMITTGLRPDFRTFDFAIPSIPRAGDERLDLPPAEKKLTAPFQRRLSDVRKLTMKKEYSLPVRKCIYGRLPYATGDGGFERKFIESLENDAKVIAHCRLHWTHQLLFHIRHAAGDTLPALCHPDFLVQTRKAVYMVETATPSALTCMGLQSRLKSAAAWCEQINRLTPASRSGLSWHYVLLLEDAFHAWAARGARSSDLLAFARLRPWEDSPSPGNTSNTSNFFPPGQ